MRFARVRLPDEKSISWYILDAGSCLLGNSLKCRKIYLAYVAEPPCHRDTLFDSTHFNFKNVYRENVSSVLFQYRRCNLFVLLFYCSFNVSFLSTLRSIFVNCCWLLFQFNYSRLALVIIDYDILTVL